MRDGQELTIQKQGTQQVRGGRTRALQEEGKGGEDLTRNERHTRVIQGTKGIKRLQCPQQCSCGGSVHKIKSKEVIKSQGLELQCHRGQIDALNFWQGCGCQLIEAGFSEQPEGLPWCLTTCSVSSSVAAKHAPVECVQILDTAC